MLVFNGIYIHVVERKQIDMILAPEWIARIGRRLNDIITVTSYFNNLQKSSIEVTVKVSLVPLACCTNLAIPDWYTVQGTIIATAKLLTLGNID